MARAKAVAIELESWGDLDLLLSKLGTKEPELTKTESDLAKKIQDLKDEHTPKIKALREEVEAAQKSITDFVLAHKSDLTEDGGKTLVLDHGIISLRLGKPSLETVGRTTWKQVLERVIALLPPRMKTKFIRTKEDLEKDAIKDAIASGELPEDKRKALGIALVQAETVYYELKAEVA
jgi:phage host-nuclease inhibitor protein Gam